MVSYLEIKVIPKSHAVLHITIIAIIAGLPVIETTIQVNGVPLPEYADDEPDAVLQELNANAQRPRNKISKHLESAKGQDLSINFSITQPFQMDCPALVFTIEVDGHKVRGKLAERDDYERKKRWSSYRVGVDKGVPGQEGAVRAF